MTLGRGGLLSAIPLLSDEVLVVLASVLEVVESLLEVSVLHKQSLVGAVMLTMYCVFSTAIKRSMCHPRAKCEGPVYGVKPHHHSHSSRRSRPA